MRPLLLVKPWMVYAAGYLASGAYEYYGYLHNIHFALSSMVIGTVGLAETLREKRKQING